MKLWIIRHAKSSWAERGMSDFDRPLNPRGLRDGPAMQAWLGQQSHLPQWLCVSDAQRTRMTSEFIVAALEPSCQVLLHHSLYLPSIHSMLDVIAETPSEITSLAIISHNPASTHMVNFLLGSNTLDNLPTLGIARLSIEKPWTELAEGVASLDFVVSPKTL